jgi:hypothetical protein
MALSAPNALTFDASVTATPLFCLWEFSMATDTNNQVVETETRATDTNAEVVGTETRATDTNAEAVGTETRATDLNATDTNNQVVETETRATDTNAEAVGTETRPTDVNATDTNNQVVETETRATDTNAEAVETEMRATNRNTEPAESEIRPDLVWDNEAPGLCVRCYGDGTKSFIFVYRIGDRQRFLRIGKTPLWSLEVARTRAKELRSIVDQGRDPARENRGREIPPVEYIIQYIAENLVPKP